MRLPVDAAVNGRSSEAEQFGELSDRVRASFVRLKEVPLLRRAQFGLSAAKVTFCPSDLHPLSRSGADQIRFELGHHREDVEQKPTHRVVRIVDRTADVELDVLGGEFVVYDAAEDIRTVPPGPKPPGPPFADPLVIPGIERLEHDLAEYLDEVDPNEHDPLIPFAFAPDELHKANISGGEHTLSLPSRAPDPIFTGVAGRPGITLVGYLRLSVTWGGLPGYSFAPHTAPEQLSRRRAGARF